MNLANGAAILAACDDRDQAQNLLEEDAQQVSEEHGHQFGRYADCMRGLRPTGATSAQAVRLFESIRGYEGGTFTGLGTTSWRGNLYLKQRMVTRLRRSSKVIESAGISIFRAPTCSLTSAWAAPLALNGDTAAARKSYQDFFAMWEDAGSRPAGAGRSAERIRGTESRFCVTSAS